MPTGREGTLARGIDDPIKVNVAAGRGANHCSCRAGQVLERGRLRYARGGMVVSDADYLAAEFWVVLGERQGGAGADVVVILSYIYLWPWGRDCFGWIESIDILSEVGGV